MNDTAHDPDGPDDRAVTRAVGAELHAARSAARLSRPAVIDRMRHPVPVNTYGCWETGARAVSIARLLDVCHALDINPAELITRVQRRLSPSEPWSQPARRRLAGELRDIAARLEHLPTPDDQQPAP